jgi:hypothetical protein
MIVQVPVTAKDIFLGKRGDPRSCAVARALNNILVPGIRAKVYVCDVVLTLADYFSYRLTLELPEEVTTFIADVDLFGAVKPMTFELNMPSLYIMKPEEVIW